MVCGGWDVLMWVGGCVAFSVSACLPLTYACNDIGNDMSYYFYLQIN